MPTGGAAAGKSLVCARLEWVIVGWLPVNPSRTVLWTIFYFHHAHNYDRVEPHYMYKPFEWRKGSILLELAGVEMTCKHDIF